MGRDVDSLPSQGDQAEPNHSDPLPTDAHSDVYEGAGSDPLDTPVVPPEWAVEAGLPPALEGETVRAYGERIGFTPERIADLFAELIPSTADMANLRLAHQLRLDLPRAWDDHIERTVRSRLDFEQRRRIRKIQQDPWMRPC